MAYINKIKKGNEAVDIQDIRIPDIVTGEGGDSGKVLVVQNDGVQFVDILNNTQLTGTPTAPTNQTASTSNGQIATTAFVHSAILNDTEAALSTSSTKPVQNKVVTTALNTKAPLASPTFTGTPQIATTPTTGDNSHKIADTAFVTTAVANKDVGVTGVKGNSESSYRTGQVNITKANLGLGNVENYSKAQILASAALTGTPTAPTPTESSGNTQIATKEYVDNFVPDLSSYMQKGVDYVTAGKDPQIAVGNKATSEGLNTRATGSYSHAEGYETNARGYASHAEGQSASATGIASHAEGDFTVASGESSHAEGNYSQATSYYSHAEGNTTTASGSYSHAEGNNTTASGTGSHAEGEYTVANRAYQHVFGTYNIVDESGSSSNDKGTYIEIVGNGTWSSGTTLLSNARTLDWDGNEVLAGKLTVGVASTNNMDVATKQYVDGKIPSVPTAGTSAPLIDGTASAGSANTWSRSDHRHPIDTSRAPLASPALTGTPTAPTATAGTSTTQIATTAFVQNAISGLGVVVDSALSDSSVNPVQNKVINTALNGKAASSHSHNLSTDVNGGVLPVTYGGTGASSVDTAPISGSAKMVTSGGVYTALGSKANLASPTFTGTPAAPTASAGTNTTQIATTAFVNNSYVNAGRKSGTTNGTKSTAEGKDVTASGLMAHGEGNTTNATGQSSHAEGEYTTASGMGSHVEGSHTTASGSYSHAEGQNTTAQRRSQHTFGEFNILDTTGADGTVRGTYVEIVGNGTSTSARANARTLDWSGNEVLAGKLTVGAAPTANMDVTTKTYVDTALSGKAASGHTHTTSIATSTGTNQITLAANTKYAITAGGTSYVFTTPPDTTYESKAAASGGTDVSLVTTGEKYTWNKKANTASPTFTGNPLVEDRAGLGSYSRIIGKNYLDNYLNRTDGSVSAPNTKYAIAMARGISAGTTDMTAGTTSLTNGTIYLYYEE